MNVIARLEYELAYYDSAVHRFNHYTTREVGGRIVGALWGVIARTYSILLATFLCNCRLASPAVLLASKWCIHTAVSTRPLPGRNCVSFYRSTTNFYIHNYSFNKVFLFSSSRSNNKIIVSKLKLQSRYYVHFWTNTLRKGMSHLTPRNQAMCWIDPLLIFYKDAFDIYVESWYALICIDMPGTKPNQKIKI